MQCEQVRRLAAAYALGALDTDERDSVMAHLTACPDCRRLVQDYEEAAATLSLAVAAASPLRPPALARDRLAIAPAAPATARALPVADEGRRRNDQRRVSISGPWSFVLRLGRARRRPQTIAALTAAVLLGLSLVWSVQLGVALARERTLRAELVQLVGQQELVLEVVDSAQTIRRLLRPPAGGASYGKLYTRPDLPHVVAMAARLSPPPPGQAYQLWLTERSQTRLAGVMAVNRQGFGLVVFDADRPGPVYDSAHLILQAEGSTAPSGTAVLQWQAGQ